MSTVTISLPETLRAWVEDRAGADGYDSPGDYVADLVRRERERSGERLSIEELRALVADAKASGVSDRSVEDIFEEAKQIWRRRNGE